MTTPLPDRWTTQQTDDQYAEHVGEAPPRCPVCRSREYHLERDRDQEGNVEQAWRECRRCGHQGPTFVQDHQDQTPTRKDQYNGSPEPRDLP